MELPFRTYPTAAFKYSAIEGIPRSANPVAIALEDFCGRYGYFDGLASLLQQAKIACDAGPAAPQVFSSELCSDAERQTLFCQVWTIPYIDFDKSSKDFMFIYVNFDLERCPEELCDLLKLCILKEVFWNEYARSYDRILPNISYYQIAIKRHFEGIMKMGARRVLDLGGGTGNVAIPLVDEGCHVTIIDTSAAMLERARQKCETKGRLGNLAIFERSAEFLDDLASESFDAVNILLVLFCIDDAVGTLEQAVRVLKPGGSIFITEPKIASDEKVLISAGESELQRMENWNDLEPDWRVVANAGHRLGGLIRGLNELSSKPNVATRRLRAEDLAVELERLGCVIEVDKDSHLSQGKYFVARKLGD